MSHARSVWHDSLSHVWMSHVTHIHDSAHSYVWHDPLCTRSHARSWFGAAVLMVQPWRGRLVYKGCAIRTATSNEPPLWKDSFICVPWLSHMWDMTHSFVWHDSIVCVTWLIHMCDMTHSYVWHDFIQMCDMTSFICVTLLIHMCDMTHSNVWHDPFLCVTWLIHTCDRIHS